MANAAPMRLYPPVPPWRIQLIGAEQDLQDLAAAHSGGRTRVIHFQGEYFLEADVLNGLTDCNRAVEEAQGILHVSSLRKPCRATIVTCPMKNTMNEQRARKCRLRAPCRP